MEKFLQKNPDYYRQYYHNNKEIIKEKRKVWYDENKTKLQAYSKNYYEKKIKNVKPKMSNRIRRQREIQRILEENKKRAEQFKLLLSQTNI